MYSTCLSCSASLGANDRIETLPTGKRIAFDSTHGRLWVICPSCLHWNLVPFDTRLESIDACEELFRGTKMRYSTDNIGLARLPGGLQLVRIGKPERRELAAWRYGARVKRRQRKLIFGGMIPSMMIAPLATAGPSLFGLTGLSEGWLLAGPSLMVGSAMGLAWLALRRHTFATVPGNGHAPMRITGAQISAARFNLDGTGAFALQLPMTSPVRFGVRKTVTAVEYHGEAALPILGRVLPHLNASMGSDREITSAITLLLERTDPNDLMSNAQRARKKWGRNDFLPTHKYPLSDIHPISRLAIEMLAHEESERAALAGELKLLERQWKEADRVAKIADDLVLEPGGEPNK